MNVDFFVLDAAKHQQALLYACKLVEQAHQDKQSIYIHMNNAEEAERFDALLWTYREDSFLPHTIFKADNINPPPIQIGFGELNLPEAATQGLLLNFAHAVPAFYTKFNRVAEIVFTDPVVQQLARERFKQYRNNGCEITTHKIKANET
jgi:DNA polymerase-3 subunit chi